MAVLPTEYPRIGPPPTEIYRGEIEKEWKGRGYHPVPVEEESPNLVDELRVNIGRKSRSWEFWLAKLWSRYVLGREFWNQ